MLEKFSKLHIGVLGDVIVDEYIYGRVSRISPEAPVPVVNFQRREFRPGGAANVALNLMNLGVRTSLLSVVGDDVTGSVLSGLVKDLHLQGATYLCPQPGRTTTCKTRVMAHSQHIVRIDHEEYTPILEDTTTALFENVRKLHADKPLDAIILQDYEKGVLHPGNIPFILSELKQLGIPVIVDPKDKNFWLYRDVTIFKPNRIETERAIGKKIPLTDAGLEGVVKELENKLGNALTFITLSEAGVYLHKGGDAVWQKATRQDIVDVCGAGDAVVSIAAAAWCAGYSLYDIALLSNIAGSQVCGQPGVAPIIGSEIEKEYLRIRK